MLVVVLYVSVYCIYMYFFFFKQKTAYEMRISDWSSDVCSSDLVVRQAPRPERLLHTCGQRRYCRCLRPVGFGQIHPDQDGERPRAHPAGGYPREIGRASCRERVCKYV